MLDETPSITKVECNEEEIAAELEVSVEGCGTNVPVKSEFHSDIETMINADEDSSYAMETAEEENQIDTNVDDADDGASLPTSVLSKGRRARKSKPSPKTKRPTVLQEKVHQCSKCEKIFNRATHLKRHMATHSDVKPYSCEICDKRFRRPDHLNIHRHHHSSIKPHVCDICQKGFTRSEHLRKHKECRHGDKTQVTIKTEFCDICQVRSIEL